MRRLEDVSPLVRSEASKALGGWGGAALVECEAALGEQLRHASGSVRCAATAVLSVALSGALSSWGADGGRCVDGGECALAVRAVYAHLPCLELRCDDSDGAVRVVALEALGRLHAVLAASGTSGHVLLADHVIDSTNHVPLVMRRLSDPSSAVRCAALRALGKMRPGMWEGSEPSAAVDPVLSRCEPFAAPVDGACVPPAAASAAAAASAPAAASAVASALLLLPSLDDAELPVRKAALEALATLGCGAVAKCAPSIVLRLACDSVGLRLAALEALAVSRLIFATLGFCSRLVECCVPVRITLR